ncbi:MAG: SulP family inorganic anion transporter [Myxococcota bacterium]
MDDRRRIRELVEKALTIARWLPSYRQRDFRGDLVAGLTVGVMVIPQGMAYALLAGLPPVYGLYASLVPLLVYPLFGTSRHLATGIVALDMLIVGSAMARMEPASPEAAAALALVLALMVGVMHLVMGLLRLGFVVEFLSRPVIAGFMVAAPLVIGLSQVGNLLGIESARSQNLWFLLRDTAAHVADVHTLTAAIGGGSVALIVLLRRFAPAVPGPLVALVLGSLAAWWFDLGAAGVDLVGAVRSGLPTPSFPAVGLDSVRALFPAALTLTLIQLLTVISLGKSLAARGGSEIRPNRELIAVGCSNIAGSLFHSPPVSASFSRTAVNAQAGARTPLANVFAAVVVAVCIFELAGALAWVPEPALAAIIMVAAFGMVNLRETRTLFRLRRLEGWLAVLTLVATLFVGIEEGVLLGVLLSMGSMLYFASRPHIAELGRDPKTGAFRDLKFFPDARLIHGVIILRVDGALSFVNAEFIRDYVLQRLGLAPFPIRAVVLDGRGINGIDTTAVAALHALIDELEERGVVLYLTELKGGVREALGRSGLSGRVDDHHFMWSTSDAVEWIEAGAHVEESEGEPFTR